MTRFVFNLEHTDRGVVWWAESPDIPGFYAAADDLISLRRHVTAALRDMGVDTAVVEQLGDAHIRFE